MLEREKSRHKKKDRAFNNGNLLITSSYRSVPVAYHVPGTVLLYYLQER
jgi:hypothetical protein